MLLDHSIQEVIQGIGHDGSEIIWPEKRDPLRRRGFHIQEVYHYALCSGYALIPYDLAPSCAPDFSGKPYILRGQGEIVADLMSRHEGLCIGIAQSGMHHCVAWDREMIFDPNGTVYGVEDFMPHVFLPLLELKL